MSSQSAVRHTAMVLLFQALGCSDGPAPSDAEEISSGEPATSVIMEEFENENSDWHAADGEWARRPSGVGFVYVQTSTDRIYPVSILRGKMYSGVDVSVRFRPLSGEIDASGGLIFRARDDQNYYVVRANSLEDNFRLYQVVEGRRRMIKSTRVEPPAIKKWHTLRVVALGDHIQAFLNDELLIDHHDSTYARGHVGLWTKADAVTEFDDFTVKGMASP